MCSKAVESVERSEPHHVLAGRSPAERVAQQEPFFPGWPPPRRLRNSPRPLAGEGQRLGRRVRAFGRAPGPAAPVVCVRNVLLNKSRFFRVGRPRGGRELSRSMCRLGRSGSGHRIVTRRWLSSPRTRPLSRPDCPRRGPRGAAGVRPTPRWYRPELGSMSAGLAERTGRVLGDDDFQKRLEKKLWSGFAATETRPEEGFTWVVVYAVPGTYALRMMSPELPPV